MRAIATDVASSVICMSVVCRARWRVPSKSGWTDQDTVCGSGFWARGTMYPTRCTLVPPGEFKGIICAATAMSAVATILVVTYCYDYWLLIGGPPATQQSIDISCSPGPQQQTCRGSVRRPDGTDRWTDGRTTDSCIDPTWHRPTMWTVPIKAAELENHLRHSKIGLVAV